MNNYEDSRWLQRFQNYQRALMHLDQAIRIVADKGIDALSDLEIQGTIKCFEMTFDLAWKTLQDHIEEQGYVGGKGPKETIQQSFKDNLIFDGNEWMQMLKSRNEAAHAYDGDMANEIISKIIQSYYNQFDELDKTLTKIKNG